MTRRFLRGDTFPLIWAGPDPSCPPGAWVCLLWAWVLSFSGSPENSTLGHCVPTPCKRGKGHCCEAAEALLMGLVLEMGLSERSPNGGHGQLFQVNWDRLETKLESSRGCFVSAWFLWLLISHLALRWIMRSLWICFPQCSFGPH